MVFVCRILPCHGQRCGRDGPSDELGIPQPIDQVPPNLTGVEGMAVDGKNC